MVKVCGRYWPVRSLNIKGICDSENVCFRVLPSLEY